MFMNKTLWTYWHQGFDQAPLLIQCCVKQWATLHPKWEIRKLDSNNIHDFLGHDFLAEESFAKLSLPHISDLIRTKLLIDYGGVWIDPTVFPVVPLEEWLDFNSEAGVFLFSRPGKDRLIANWFIASRKNSRLLQSFSKMGQKLCTRLEKRKYK